MASAELECAHCGICKPSLKKCPCGIVQYCDASCQKANRGLHKKICRRLLSGEDECPICAIPVPFDPERRCWMACCGAVMCSSCSDAHEESAWGGAGCPFCRAVDPPTREGELRRLVERKEKGDLNAYVLLACEHGDQGSLPFGMVPRDEKRGFELMLYAAERGQVDALYHVGLAYDFGRGCERDPNKAFEWFQRAAKEGDMMSCHNLGCRYGNGEGVRQSWAKAKFWFERGAALGDPSSIDHLRMMNQRGHSEGDVSVSEEDVAVALRAFHAATSHLDAKAREARNQMRGVINVSSSGAPIL